MTLTWASHSDETYSLTHRKLHVTTIDSSIVHERAVHSVICLMGEPFVLAVCHAPPPHSTTAMSWITEHYISPLGFSKQPITLIIEKQLTISEKCFSPDE